MRLHVAALPHTRVEPSFSTCAYTAKVLKFARMMGDRGHEVVVYATEGPEIPGASLYACLSEEERALLYPPAADGLPAWPDDWTLFNARAAAGIVTNAQPRDFVLLCGGYSQLPLSEQLRGELLVCEPGVGYEGVFTQFRAFESYAWMHHVYGIKGESHGRFYDAVIPNYFDPDDFEFSGRRGDYLLFLGRLINHKGPHIAAKIAERLGMKLVVAGPGGAIAGDGSLAAADVLIEEPVEYVGAVGVEQRAELLTGAAALIAPTTYIEPFGGVAVEAMLAGTPAVTTDWGAFTETVEEGVSGYRFRTLAEGCEAVERATKLSRSGVRRYALERYSLDAVAPQFERWFERLENLWERGWDAA